MELNLFSHQQKNSIQNLHCISFQSYRFSHDLKVKGDQIIFKFEKFFFSYPGKTRNVNNISAKNAPILAIVSKSWQATPKNTGRKATRTSERIAMFAMKLRRGTRVQVCFRSKIDLQSRSRRTYMRRRTRKKNISNV